MHRSNLWFGFTQLGMFHPLSLSPFPLFMHALVHDSLVSSLRANQFLPNENWLSGIRGTSPSFDASIERPSFFPSCSNFRFFFFFFFVDFDTGTVKSSRIFILEMKLLTLNFIIEDNFFLERSFVVFPFYRCLYKIELFGRYFWG